eukprot:COSAG02_NODE_2470_length_8748_cov_14.026477_6_plen_75_part_00
MHAHFVKYLVVVIRTLLQLRLDYCLLTCDKIDNIRHCGSDVVFIELVLCLARGYCIHVMHCFNICDSSLSPAVN